MLSISVALASFEKVRIEVVKMRRLLKLMKWRLFLLLFLLLLMLFPSILQSIATYKTTHFDKSL